MRRLSDAQQEQVQHQESRDLTTPGIYSDGGGLYLRVRQTGTRSWLFICMIKGKRREMGLPRPFAVEALKTSRQACRRPANEIATRPVTR